MLLPPLPSPHASDALLCGQCASASGTRKKSVSVGGTAVEAEAMVEAERVEVERVEAEVEAERVERVGAEVEAERAWW